MQLVFGDIWDQVNFPADITLITTNSVLNTNDCLVMGAGTALQAKQRNPELPRLFGEKIRKIQSREKRYGLVLLHDLGVGAFQTKTHYKYPADLDLIGLSTEMLCQFLEEEDYRDFKVNLPFPGIGKGGLKPETVLPIITVLPENVRVFQQQ